MKIAQQKQVLAENRKMKRAERPLSAKEREEKKEKRLRRLRREGNIPKLDSSSSKRQKE